jgi:hypothetical protein
MQTPEQQPKPGAFLEHLLDEATAALIRARIDYAALESDDGVDQQALAAAWLRLWRAQARHVQLSSRFEWAP